MILGVWPMLKAKQPLDPVDCLFLPLLDKTLNDSAGRPGIRKMPVMSKRNSLNGVEKTGPRKTTEMLFYQSVELLRDNFTNDFETVKRESFPILHGLSD